MLFIIKGGRISYVFGSLIENSLSNSVENKFLLINKLILIKVFSFSLLLLLLYSFLY